VNVPRLNVTGLLRPTAGVPGEEQEIAERVAFGVAFDQFGEAFRSDVGLDAAAAAS
jgi:hypothetical protein